MFTLCDSLLSLIIWLIQDDPPGLETVEIPPTRKEKEVSLKESTQKEKEVIQKEREVVTQKEKVVSPAVEQKLKEKKVEEVEVTTIDDDDDDDTDPVRYKIFNFFL